MGSAGRVIGVAVPRVLSQQPSNAMRPIAGFEVLSSLATSRTLVLLRCSDPVGFRNPRALSRLRGRSGFTTR